MVPILHTVAVLLCTILRAILGGKKEILSLMVINIHWMHACISSFSDYSVIITYSAVWRPDVWSSWNYWPSLEGVDWSGRCKNGGLGRYTGCSITKTENYGANECFENAFVDKKNCLYEEQSLNIRNQNDVDIFIEVFCFYRKFI